jgi:hypothetical protein
MKALIDALLVPSRRNLAKRSIAGASAGLAKAQFTNDNEASYAFG